MSDGQIVITRVGSGYENQGTDNNPDWKPTKPHKWQDPAQKACISALEDETTFLQVASSNCEYLPTTVSGSSNSFIVLGLYRPSFLWCETRGGVDVIKMKSEAEALDTHPYYVNPNTAPPLIRPEDVENLVRADRQVCKTCNQESPAIYRSGWVCLNLRDFEGNAACSAAQAAQEVLKDGEKNDLAPRFLAERLDRKGVAQKVFVPPWAPTRLIGKGGQDLEDRDIQELRNGVCCPVCRAAIMRVTLTGWTCACGNYSSPIPIPVMPLDRTVQRQELYSTGGQKAIKILSPLAEVKDSFSIPGYRVWVIEIWDIMKQQPHRPVYFGIPNDKKGAASDGPDQRYYRTAQAIFDGTMDIARRVKEKAPVKGMYSRYFTWQCGKPYKYSLKHETAQNVPDFVRTDWTDLEQTLSAVVGSSNFVEPTQMMYNYYLDDGGISLHSDADTTGYIMSESLGADGNFLIKLHEKVYATKEFRGMPGTPDMPRPETKMREELDAFMENENNRSEEAIRGHLRSADPEKPKEGPRLVSIRMTHGSFVAMPGDEFQEGTKHQATVPGNGKYWPRINITLRALTK